jgi:hypothetical protein
MDTAKSVSKNCRSRTEELAGRRLVGASPRRWAFAASGPLAVPGKAAPKGNLPVPKQRSCHEYYQDDKRRHEFVTTVMFTGAEVAEIPPLSVAMAVRL